MAKYSEKPDEQEKNDSKEALLCKPCGGVMGGGKQSPPPGEEESSGSVKSQTEGLAGGAREASRPPCTGSSETNEFDEYSGGVTVSASSERAGESKEKCSETSNDSGYHSGTLESIGGGGGSVCPVQESVMLPL